MFKKSKILFVILAVMMFGVLSSTKAQALPFTAVDLVCDPAP